MRPVVDLLKAWHIPRAVGAALVLGAIVGALSWAAFSLGDDAALELEEQRRAWFDADEARLGE